MGGGWRWEGGFLQKCLVCLVVQVGWSVEICRMLDFSNHEKDVFWGKVRIFTYVML